MEKYLPQAFEERMREMLGEEEYAQYIRSYEDERQYGLRVNTLKCSPEELERSGLFGARRIPWVENGFFYDGDERPARHPYYSAGVYYLQEPSAMTPASRLEVHPGERVLDLCAAPGGKATELGAKLQGRGILVANDISNSRAKALLRNLELFGVKNAFVTNELPGKLASCFPEYFDRILVDAPCSGEGMFRKDPAVAKTWDEDRPAYFAKLQRDIVMCASRMLRPGGTMLYSTCTFAKEENEGTVSWLLSKCPELHLEEMIPYEGFSEGRPEWGDGREDLRKCVRIFPHKMHGEGHFLALIRKEGDRRWNGSVQKTAPTDKKDRATVTEFMKDVTADMDWNRMEIRAGKAYLVPELPDTAKGIRFLRNGLLLGELKKGRFEPSQPFAMTLRADQYASALCLKPEDERVERYLRGETIYVQPGECAREKGWQLVCADTYALGWGKLVNGVLKNKYLSGWRKN